MNRQKPATQDAPCPAATRRGHARFIAKLKAALILATACFPILLGGSAGADELAKLKADHPRLLCSDHRIAEVQDQAQRDPLLARLIDQLRANARAMLDEPVVVHDLVGPRLLPQSRACLRRVETLAMAYRLTRDRRFADRATREMLAASGFKDWNPSHFLDVAEMTTALAIGYDWLYDHLNAAQRETIERAIVEKGLRPGLERHENKAWWTHRINNWNQVCNAGLTLGALAVAEKRPRVARAVLARTVPNIKRGLAVYAPDGAYPEGPGYWHYGTIYSGLMIDALRTSLGDDFGLAATDGLAQTGLFRIHTIGPTGRYFNYADSGLVAKPVPEMFLLARLYDRPGYAQWHREKLADRYMAGESVGPRRIGRNFAMEIAWYQPSEADQAVAELPLSAVFQGRQDIGAMRSAWDDPEAVYVAFKGGDNQTPHGHLDVGTFVFDAMGQRWASDLGGDDYGLPGYFEYGPDAKRWDYFRLGTRGHNTLTIDDRNQAVEGRGEIVAHQFKTDRSWAVLDMSSAYAGQAKRVRRGIAMFADHTVLIRDEVDVAEGEVRWAMITKAEIQLCGDTATLKRNGKELEVRVVSPEAATLRVESTTPDSEAEQPNEGTRMLTCRVKPSGVGHSVRLSVILRKPDASKVSPGMARKPLDTWLNEP